MNKKKLDKVKEKQNKKLDFLIREYDCKNLQELIDLSKEDALLHRLLRECGIRFNS
jgi:hypothetical protein